MIKPSTRNNIIAYYQGIGRNRSFMSKFAYTVFGVVASVYENFSRKTGIPYAVVSVIVSYLLVPCIVALIADTKTSIFRAGEGSLPLLTLMLLCFWGGILFVTRSKFYSWCDYTFNKSVNRMAQFRKFGWHYEENCSFFFILLPFLTIFIFLFI